MMFIIQLVTCHICFLNLWRGGGQMWMRWGGRAKSGCVGVGVGGGGGAIWMREGGGGSQFWIFVCGLQILKRGEDDNINDFVV